MVLSFCRRPRSTLPAPRYSALGAAWLGAEQFRPQHFRNKEGDPPTHSTSGTSIISAEPGHCRAGISLRRLWLLHPVERRKGRPGAYGAAWWSAAEVLVLPAPRSRRGPDALGWEVVNAVTIQGDNKVISVSTGHGVRATRESSECVKQQLARCAIVLARATIRSRLGATPSKNDARATSLDAASDCSDQDRRVKRPGNIPAYAACPTGESRHTISVDSPTLKSTVRQKHGILIAAHQPCDPTRSTNAQIWIRHFRHAADHGASGR
jgi:hypothetical protein